jgi:hypothetical protein
VIDRQMPADPGDPADGMAVSEVVRIRVCSVPG